VPDHAKTMRTLIMDAYELYMVKNKEPYTPYEPNDDDDIFSYYDDEDTIDSTYYNNDDRTHYSFAYEYENYRGYNRFYAYRLQFKDYITNYGGWRHEYAWHINDRACYNRILGGRNVAEKYNFNFNKYDEFSCFFRNFNRSGYAGTFIEVSIY
jgi:hypothetical protein